MKRNLTILLAILSFGAASCTQSSFWEQPNNVRVVAHTESVASKSLVWKAEDKLSIIGEDGSDVVFNIEAAGNTHATFYTYDWSGATPIYAVYPAAQEGRDVLAGNLIGVTLPSEYNVTDVETCGAFAAIGSLTGKKNVYTSLPMKNVMGIVKVTIDRPSVTYLKLESVAGESLTGKVLVDYGKMISDDADFIQTVEGEGVSSVVIRPEPGSKAAASDGSFVKGDYYLSVLPQVYSEGFVITMGQLEGEPYVVEKKVTLSISRNKVFDVDDLLPDDITITLPFLNDQQVNPLGTFVAWSSQSASGDDYKYTYDYLYAGNPMQHEFVFTVYAGNKYSFEAGKAPAPNNTKKLLFVSPGGKWAIKLPAIKGRYLKSVSFKHVGTTYTRNFRLQEGYPTAGHYFTANPQAIDAAEGVTATVSIPTTATTTAQLKETKVGTAYYVQLSSNANYYITSIEVVYTREKPKNE